MNGRTAISHTASANIAKPTVSPSKLPSLGSGWCSGKSTINELYAVIAISPVIIATHFFSSWRMRGDLRGGQSIVSFLMSVFNSGRRAVPSRLREDHRSRIGTSTRKKKKIKRCGRYP